MTDIAHIQQLPCYHQATIPEAYLDVMGHMNIQHYMSLFDKAAWKFFASFGMDDHYYQTTTGGAFALEQHICYLAEVKVGETVGIYTRINGRTAKRIHFVHFMVNETTHKLAATLETLTSHANTTTRRTSPFPAAIAEAIDAILAEHQQLAWEIPLCGVIRP